jgi:hypothetical protein
MRSGGIDRRQALAAIAAMCGTPLLRGQGVPVQVPAPRGENVSTEAKALRRARWTPERATQYMQRFGAIRGCNYVAADASSVWAETLGRNVDRELGWASDSGLNSVRVFIPLTLHQEIGDALFSRIDRFLDVTARHKLSFTPVLSANSMRDPNYKPEPGARNEPTPAFLPGVHGGPPRPRPWLISARRNLEAVKPPAARFVNALLRHYARDERIVAWDLFNEPVPDDRAMVEHVFACAREVDPSQPLTATWQGEDLSDVYSFHTYGQPGNAQGGEPELLPFDVELKQAVDSRRPLLCTECLARTFGNTFEAFLPYFAQHKVGWYIWGLCAGTAQHHYPWRWPVGAPEPKNWFHCILYPDGTPYRDHEIELIRNFHF